MPIDSIPNYHKPSDKRSTQRFVSRTATQDANKLDRNQTSVTS